MTTDLENAPALPDVQSSPNFRKLAINRVGVTDVSYPIQFVSRVGMAPQATVAKFDMFVSLAADQKGTHMSRFLQILDARDSPFDFVSLLEFCKSIQDKLDADDARMRVSFPYFVTRSAPVTGESGKLRLDVALEVCTGETTDMVTTVSGPATSLCPCSKKISERGAHNQRCELTVSVRCQSDGQVSLEELFEMMEGSASTQVFPILKRPDEKWVTEDAYDRPKFVEDIVRDLATALEKHHDIKWFRCSSENFESIHQHNAFAEIERGSAV